MYLIWSPRSRIQITRGCALKAHTDSVGTDAWNQDLSERRAASVLGYLGRQGVAEQRFEVRAFGESMPLQSNSSRDGRRENRRVELIVK